MKKPVLAILALAFVAALAGAVGGDASPARTGTPRLVAMAQLTVVDDATFAGFRAGMAALGYQEGRDVRYLASGAVGKPELLDDALRTLLDKNPDLLVVASTPAAQAAKRLTEARRHPPVVFAPVNDPLGAGIVGDLRHPGGHIAGIRLPQGDAPRMKWLLRIAPGVQRVYLPHSPDDDSALASLRQAREVARALGVILLPRAVRDPARDEVPPEADAIFIPRDSRVEAHIGAYVALADKRRLPLSAPSLAQVREGALFSYGFVHREIGAQAARLAGQILKGRHPGDLPVEMAENRLAINLVAARRIGIAIPDDLLRQAEFVIRE
jgi:putative ABC transport system substrate-binding protein